MPVVEIDKEDTFIQSRTFASNGDKPARTIYWQSGYAYLGGRYPVQIQIPLDEGVPAYSAGEYDIHSSSFQVNKYNKLELNPYNIKLVQIKTQAKAPQ